MKGKKAGKPGKPKQERLIPRDETHRFPDIAEAAEKYAGLRDERMALGKQEADASDELLRLMDKHGIAKDGYLLPDGREVTVDESRKVRVRKPKDDAEEAA